MESIAQRVMDYKSLYSEINGTWNMTTAQREAIFRKYDGTYIEVQGYLADISSHGIKLNHLEDVSLLELRYDGSTKSSDLTSFDKGDEVVVQVKLTHLPGTISFIGEIQNVRKLRSATEVERQVQSNITKSISDRRNREQIGNVFLYGSTILLLGAVGYIIYSVVAWFANNDWAWKTLLAIAIFSIMAAIVNFFK
jgi:hypothetical protein